MKTKHFIYFLQMFVGAVLLANDGSILRKEYSMSLGIVLLMSAVYMTSRSYGREGERDEPSNPEP